MMSKSQLRPESTLNSTERKRPFVHGTRTCSRAPAATHVPLLCSIHRVAGFCSWDALMALLRAASAWDAGPRELAIGEIVSRGGVAVALYSPTQPQTYPAAQPPSPTNWRSTRRDAVMDSTQLTKLAAVAGASGAAVALLVAKLLLDGGARRAVASAPGDTPDDAKRSAHVEQGRLAVGQGLAVE